MRGKHQKDLGTSPCRKTIAKVKDLGGKDEVFQVNGKIGKGGGIGGRRTTKIVKSPLMIYEDRKDSAPEENEEKADKGLFGKRWKKLKCPEGRMIVKKS